jgi:hypothetical protein
MINTKLQSIIDTKSAIGNAITNKGGTITTNTPFFNYAAQIDGISTGTPQTIFAASDGSKWALTNAVNLVNDAGNVTSDFNYWQPANNSTSDPILNVGTVGANISGNIQLVPVNQVNIAQFENIVINDTTGAKYVGYNGYDFSTNPTPTGNTTFNRWLLNNSASGTIVFANTTVVSGGTFNGPNSTINTSQLNLISNVTFGSGVNTIVTNNGILFAGGLNVSTNRSIASYHESNLVQISTAGNFPSFGLANISLENGFVYGVGGSFSNSPLRKYHESNLVFVSEANTGNRESTSSVAKDNFVYVGTTGSTAVAKVQKFHAGNLVRIANSPLYNADRLRTIAVNNGFVFAAGGPNKGISKYHESNLVFNASSPIYGEFGDILILQISNGFVYAGGTYPGNADATNGQGIIRKYHEGNLAYTGIQSANYAGNTNTMFIDGEFIYAGGEQRTGVDRSVQKLHKDNLVLLVNVPNLALQTDIRSVTVNNGFVYAGGFGASNFSRINKLTKEGVTPDNQTFYTATKIKE